jgi:hypothetical protein
MRALQSCRRPGRARLACALGLLGASCTADFPTCTRAGDVGCPQTGSPQVRPDLLDHFVVRRGVFAAGAPLALGDCNDDGRTDLLAGREVWAQAADGAFVAASTIGAAVSPRAVLWFDVDRDGRLDALVAGAQILMARGLGECRFAEATVIPTIAGGAQINQLIATDVDQDGLVDIGVAQAVSEDSPFHVLVARGDGTFDDVAPQQAPSSGRRPLGFRTFVPFFEDVDADGTQDFFGLVDSGNSWFAWGVAGGRLAFERDPRLSDDLASRDPMGVSALDFDRDGRLDYWLSGTPDASRLWRSDGARRLFASERFAGLAGDDGLTDWAPYAFDADLDGWMDMLVLRRRGLDEPVAPAVPRLLINLHDGTFTDVGPRVIGEAFRARSMACGDLARAGHVSCLVFDADGVARIDGASPGHAGWAGVRLRGTVSNSDALGARVVVVGARPARIVAVGGQVGVEGASSNEVLLATLGASSLPLEIRWPSGLVSTTNAEAMRYTEAVEPEVLGLSARVLPADGRATVEIVVDAARGRARDATVEGAGDGGWAGPATRSAEGIVRRSWRASASPGRARFTVSLDGVALNVHPVVRFR